MKSVKSRSFVERYLYNSLALYLEQAAFVRFAGAELVLGSQCPVFRFQLVLVTRRGNELRLSRAGGDLQPLHCHWSLLVLPSPTSHQSTLHPCSGRSLFTGVIIFV